MHTYYDCIFKVTDQQVAHILAFDFIMQPERFVRCRVEYDGIISMMDEFANRWKWENRIKG